MPIKLKLIAAACENMGIGKNNNLPWKLKSEMEYFTKLTTKTEDRNKNNVVIMGRKTWDSIPKKFKPLSNRINFILSRSELDIGNHETYCFKSWEECIERLEDAGFKNLYENVWVIGGSHIYEEAMKSKYFHRLYITRILKTFECDTFFPDIPTNLVKISDYSVPEGKQVENGLEFIYEVFEKPETS